MGFLRFNKTPLTLKKVGQSAVFLLLVLGFFYILFDENIALAKNINLGTTGDTLILNGNVGIGTTNPLRKLVVSGPDDGNGQLRLMGTADTVRWWDVGRESAVNGRFKINEYNNGTETERLTILMGGNVGIGTTNPGAKLDIVTATAPFIGLKISNYSANANALFAGAVDDTSIFLGTGYYYNSNLYRTPGTAAAIARFDAGTYKIFTDSGLTANTDYTPSERLRITSTGNVGIGTTNPTQKLDVSGIIKTSGNIMQGNTINRSLVSWSQSGTATGTVIISLPGTAGVNWGMVQMEINVYEYGTNSATTFTCGGHNWSTRWYNYSCSSEGLSDKKIRLGVKDGKYVVAIGEPGVAWSYGHVILSRITNPEFYSGNLDLSGPYSVTLDNNPDAYTWISADLNRFNARQAYFAGNVGIGIAAPGTTLDVSGTGSFRAKSGTLSSIGAGLIMADASGNLYSTSTAVATGIPSPAGISGQTLRSDGTNWIANSLLYNNGTNVGIGTVAPGSKLSVAGIGVSNTSLTLAQLFNNIPYVAGNGLGAARLELGHGIAQGYIESASDVETDSSRGYLALGTRRPVNNVAEAMRINSAGNVGIGTTNPLYKLTILPVTNNGIAVRQADDGGNALELVSDNDGGVIRMYSGATEVNHLTYTGNTWFNTGNVGIGTTNPSEELEVNGTAKALNGDEIGYRPFALFYSYDTVVHNYWNRVFRLTPSTANITFQVLIKDDRNYVDYGLYVVQAAKYADNNFSLEVDRIAGNNTDPFYVTVDNSGYVWIKGTGAWSYFAGYKVLQNAGADILSGAAILTQEANPEATMVTRPSTFIKATLSGGVFTVIPGSSGFSDIVRGVGGDIGIATTNPGATLDVSGTGNFRAKSGTLSNIGSGVIMADASGNLYSTSTAVATGIPSPAGIAGQTLRSNGTNWIANNLLYNNGTNIGVGTTNPSSVLDVNAGASNGINIQVGSSPAGVFNELKIGLDSWTSANRGLRFQQWTDTASYNQYLIYNGRLSGTAPTYNQGLYGRFSGIEFNSGDTNFLVNTGAVGVGAETAITPTKALTIQYTGNVGIGTTTPMAKLDVYNNAAYYATNLAAVNNSSIAFRIKSRATWNTTLAIGAIGDVDKIGFQAFDSSLNTAKDILLNPFGGNVGIGTINPGAKLQVEDSTAISLDTTAASNGNLIIKSNTGGRTTTSGAQLEFVIPANTDGSNPYGQGRIMTVAGNSTNTNATGKMILGTRRYFNKLGTGNFWYYGDDITIDGNGNVGIGTTTPGATLDVTGTVASFRAKSGTLSNIGSGVIMADASGNLYSTSTAIATGIPSPAGISGQTLRSNGTNWIANNLLFNNGTNVGIGTTSPGEKLEINGNLKLNGFLRWGMGGASGANLIPISADAWRNTVSMWTNNSTITIVDPPAGADKIPSGKVHQITDPTNGSVHFIDQLIAIDTDKTYYGQIWSARIAGTGTLYAGYAAYDKDLNLISGNGGSYGYFITSAANPSATGTWYYGKIQGEGAAVNNFPVGTRYIKPMIYLNYNTGGTTDVGAFVISDTPFEGNSGNYDLATQGTTRLFIDNTGDVGIGTTNPGAKLEVYGAGQTVANITDAGSRADMIALNGASSAAGSGGALIFGNAQSLIANSLGWAAIKGYLTNGGGNTAGDLTFLTRNASGDTALTERMRILSNGYVGIGTTLPGAKLDVENLSAGINEGIRLSHKNDYGSGSKISWWMDNATESTNITSAWYPSPISKSYISFATYGPSLLERMRINGDGYVGMGLTDPEARLHVKGMSSAWPAISGTVPTGLSTRFQPSDSNVALDIGANGGLGAWLQTTNRGDLSLEYPLLLNPNGGNVAIGATTTGATLDIRGAVASLRANSATLANIGSGMIMADASGNLYSTSTPFATNIIYNYKQVSTANYTVLTTDYIIGYNGPGGTITLPSSCTAGRAHEITNESATVTVTITTANTSISKISGQNSISLSPYNSIPVYCNGTNWFIY